jgi:hypothetical protein
MLDAETARQQGDRQKAMRQVCAALLTHLAQVDFQRGFAALPVSQFLECGVRFVLTETGLRHEFLTREFSAENCERALQLGRAVLAAPLPRTVQERLHALLQRWSVQLMQAAKPTPMHARLLCLLHALRLPLRRRLPAPRGRDAAAAQLISLLLQEPLEQAHRLLQRHGLEQELLRLRQQHSPCSHGPVHWPDRDAYRAWLRQHPGSRVLVTVHMGHYREAFHWLAAEAGAGRHVISLQRELDDTHVHLHRVDERLRQEVHGRELETPGRVVAALRGGKTTLAVLCDLGPRFGATEKVTLFGYPARLVRGPALLALLGEAPLLPFVMLSRGGRDCLLMAPAILPRLLSGETLPEGVQRITSLLALHLERWVRMAPEQWRFLPSAGMFLQEPAAGARH